MLLYSEDPLSKNTRITFLLPEEAMHFNLLVFPEIFHDFSSYVRLDLPILLHFPVHKHVKTHRQLANLHFLTCNFRLVLVFLLENSENS